MRNSRIGFKKGRRVGGLFKSDSRPLNATKNCVLGHSGNVPKGSLEGSVLVRTRRDFHGKRKTQLG